MNHEDRQISLKQWQHRQVKEPGSKTSRLRLHQPAMRTERTLLSGSDSWHWGRNRGRTYRNVPFTQINCGASNDSIPPDQQYLNPSNLFVQLKTSIFSSFSYRLPETIPVLYVLKGGKYYDQTGITGYVYSRAYQYVN